MFERRCRSARAPRSLRLMSLQVTAKRQPTVDEGWGGEECEKRPVCCLSGPSTR